MRKPVSQGTASDTAWRRELLVLAAIVVATTALFWTTDLDIRFSGIFFKPDHPDGPWPYFESTIWRVLYESDDFLTVSLSVLALGLILVGLLKRRRRRYARYGLFILLGGLIGAGLLTNMTFKEYWGHPRPDNTVEFGGELAYLPPLMKGTAGNGESFPSGHVSIAFSFISIWFLLRLPKPRAAGLCLIAVLALTGLEGIGRMVRGRHFLSDVLWGAYIPYLVCFVLYYWVFRLNKDESRRTDSG